MILILILMFISAFRARDTWSSKLTNHRINTLKYYGLDVQIHRFLRISLTDMETLEQQLTFLSKLSY